MNVRPKLYVEGQNDIWVIINLLRKHGINLPEEGVRSVLPLLQCIDAKDGASGVDRLIKLIDSRVNVSETPVGFVIDADESVGLTNRWVSIGKRLRAAGVAVPKKPPENGFVGIKKDTNIPVGVWLMPDNVRDGTLEDFLQDLIDNEDALIGLAKSCTQKALQTDPRFRVVDTSKAELHAWLAWQKKPGLPYGSSITAGCFEVNDELALRFVNWLKELYSM